MCCFKVILSNKWLYCALVDDCSPLSLYFHTKEKKKKKTTKTHKVQDQLYHAQSYQSPSKGGTVTMKKTGLMDLKTVILQYTVSFFF